MSLLKTFIDLCTINHYITIENIFVIIIHSFLVVQKYLENILMIVLKLIPNK